MPPFSNRTNALSPALKMEQSTNWSLPKPNQLVDVNGAQAGGNRTFCGDTGVCSLPEPHTLQCFSLKSEIAERAYSFLGQLFCLLPTCCAPELRKSEASKGRSCECSARRDRQLWRLQFAFLLSMCVRCAVSSCSAGPALTLPQSCGQGAPLAGKMFKVGVTGSSPWRWERNADN